MCSNILTGFLSLETPGTVTIAPVTAAPVPTAVGISDKESLGKYQQNNTDPKSNRY